MNFAVVLVLLMLAVPHALSLGLGTRSQSQDEAQALEAVQVVRIIEAAELANSLARVHAPVVHPYAYAQPHFAYNPHHLYARSQFSPHYGHYGQFYSLPPSYFYPQPQARHYIYRVYNSRK